MSSMSWSTCALICALLLGLGVWQLAQAGQIAAKAWLAEALIESAWERSSQSEMPEKPWPWADTWPVAELHVPRLGIQRYVLYGDSGQALAFGAGQTVRGGRDEASGLVQISGHRDTHFAFLQELERGERLSLQTLEGTRHYTIETMQVVNGPSLELETDIGEDWLMLVTCYPFEMLGEDSDQRYIVLARAEAP